MSSTLAYEFWGEGPDTLVALHGFTQNRSAWRAFEPHWGLRFRVLAVDLPGHGESARATEWDFARTVDAVDALCAALEIDRAFLLGYSMGARIALGLAMRHPERWEKLVLESGSPGLHRRKERVERKRADEALAERIEREGIEAFVDRWERLPLFEGIAKLSFAEQAEIRARRLACDARGLSSALRGFGLGVQPDLWPKLPRLRTPTLLLTGACDSKFTEIARRMAGELPSAWHRRFAEAHHAPHLEVMEAYSAEVRAFLEAPWLEDQASEQLEDEPELLAGATA